MNRSELAREVAHRAARLRADMKIGAAQPVCPFDIAAWLGIAVRFDALPSLEGMYSPGKPPAIVLTSLRPAGRRRFTCAHEIGHHLFGHGYHIDEMNPGRSRAMDVEEFIADRFAAALLMPKLAVANAFVRRGIEVASASPAEVFTVAQDLGVGFTTLVDHMWLTLHLIEKSQATTLSKLHLPNLRAHIAGSPVPKDLFPIDSAWGERPLDVEPGDRLLLPKGSEVKGTALGHRDGMVVAEVTGVAQVALPRRRTPLQVRVCRREYVGLAPYRYLEDCDD